MKCVLTEVVAGKPCAWCNKKTDCVEITIEATFFRKNLLCWKCMRKAIELRHRQKRHADVNALPTDQSEKDSR